MENDLILVIVVVTALAACLGAIVYGILEIQAK
jgi:hypothetical protein